MSSLILVSDSGQWFTITFCRKYLHKNSSFVSFRWYLSCSNPDNCLFWNTYFCIWNTTSALDNIFFYSLIHRCCAYCILHTAVVHRNNSWWCFILDFLVYMLVLLTIIFRGGIYFAFQNWLKFNMNYLNIYMYLFQLAEIAYYISKWLFFNSAPFQADSINWLYVFNVCT